MGGATFVGMETPQRVHGNRTFETYLQMKFFMQDIGGDIAFKNCTNFGSKSAHEPIHSLQFYFKPHVAQKGIKQTVNCATPSSIFLARTETEMLANIINNDALQ